MNQFWRAVTFLLGGGCIYRGILFIKDFTDARPVWEETPGIPLGGASALDLTAGIVLIIVGAGLLAPSLVRVFAAPFTAFIDSVFLPHGKSEKPPADLNLPAFYQKEARHEEALAEYRKIIRYHPEEFEAWIGALGVLAGPLDDFPAARILYRKGLRRFRGKTDETLALEKAWEEILSQRTLL